MFDSIDGELRELANFVVQDDVGHVREREAWARINELLDIRNELGRLPVGLTVEAVSENFL
jgi:hypothetical protein